MIKNIPILIVFLSSCFGTIYDKISVATAPYCLDSKYAAEVADSLLKLIPHDKLEIKPRLVYNKDLSYDIDILLSADTSAFFDPNNYEFLEIHLQGSKPTNEYIFLTFYARPVNELFIDSTIHIVTRLWIPKAGNSRDSKLVNCIEDESAQYCNLAKLIVTPVDHNDSHEFRKVQLELYNSLSSSEYPPLNSEMSHQLFTDSISVSLISQDMFALKDRAMHSIHPGVHDYVFFDLHPEYMELSKESLFYLKNYELIECFVQDYSKGQFLKSEIIARPINELALYDGVYFHIICSHYSNTRSEPYGNNRDYNFYFKFTNQPNLDSGYRLNNFQYLNGSLYRRD